MQTNLDKPESLTYLKNKINKKQFLKLLYKDFYKELRPKKIPKGKIIEIGSGPGFIKDIIPNAITTDVVKGQDIDKVFSATKIPYKNNTVSCFVMLNVFHHIKNPQKALKEMLRCLKPGGKIVMLEPYITPLSYLVYKYIHYEAFDANSKWKIMGSGRMTGANTALPWIVFNRDREIFKKNFPNLEISRVKIHTPFSYILSGGVSKYQLVPSSAFSLIRKIEKKIAPINNFIGMFATIELKKIK